MEISDGKFVKCKCGTPIWIENSCDYSKEHVQLSKAKKLTYYVAGEGGTSSIPAKIQCVNCGKDIDTKKILRMQSE